MIDDPQEQAGSPLDASDQSWGDPLAEQLGELLRRTTVPAMPDLVRTRLDTAIRQAQAEREAGDLAQAHHEALVAAAKRTALGSFGPNPIHPRTTFRGRWSRARTIGA
ncbi:hypothetical protein SDC9_99839 [bioreactor metagenome]|uniref:Uncharacterized protein n=1 Tax=bioreactor metagenome TaxID=1076179 RepID=A0A645AIN5_9ZZZZ